MSPDISYAERQSRGLCGKNYCPRQRLPGLSRCAVHRNLKPAKIGPTGLDYRVLKPCNVKLTANASPPWAEQLRDLQWIGETEGGGDRYIERWVANPERPNEWMEIVCERTKRIVMRSQRRASVLVPVLAPGERLVLARRRGRGAPATAARYWL